MVIDKSKIVVRELMLGDFDNITGFYETLNNLSPSEALDKKTSESILEEINHERGHVFVAIYNNEIIGITELFIEQKFIRRGAKCGHIEEVVTRKGYEKQGVATLVLKHVIKYAEEAGCYKIVLYCEPELETFYNRFNLKTSGIEMVIRF